MFLNEIPGWQHVSKEEAWRKQCLKNAEVMVKEQRNHPSLIAHGVRVDESIDDDELYLRTNAAAHELDPSRPTGGVRYLKKSSLLEDVYTYNDFSKTYIVDKIEFIRNTDWSYLENTEENKITMITCTENEPDYRLCVQATEKE